MARTGRPPKPIEVKRRSGNPGKRRLPEPLAIVPVPDGPPAAPPALGKDGRALWEGLWAAVDWLSPTDAFLAGLLCELEDERQSWAAAVRKAGPVYVSKSGAQHAHPGVTQVREIQRQQVAVASLLGLSPSDRGRLGLAEVKKLTGLAEILKMRRDLHAQ